MAKLIGILGPTGSGKSTSIRTMNPKDTFVISVAAKELPFKMGDKDYNKENKNFSILDSTKTILAEISGISEHAPHVKNIIIDDGNYIMGFDLVNKATETGYTKFSLLAQGMVNLIQQAKKLRPDLLIFYFSHIEEIEDGGDITSYKMKTAGKLIDSQITMEGLFNIVLYTFVETKGEKSDYYFLTNRFLKYPAKTPAEMFSTIKIPNDLALVAKTVREYYA